MQDLNKLDLYQLAALAKWKIKGLHKRPTEDGMVYFIYIQMGNEFLPMKATMARKVLKNYILNHEKDT